MDDGLLPPNFDLIVVGTGVTESVVSAAASRIGKRVLHIDKDDFYGGQWASFNLDRFHTLPEIIQSRNATVEAVNDLPCENDLFMIENFNSTWYIPEKDNTNENQEQAVEERADQQTSTHTQEYLLKESRKFNIDLAPKLNFARGNYVELLISSNIARYSEYRSVSRVLTWINGHLEIVPSSRSDVFANSKVSVIEKRMLMKLLTSLDDGNEDLKAYENKSFSQFLKDKNLTPNLIHYVLYSISMSDNDTPCSEGVKRTKRFLTSLGRFGKTPFLFSMYGSGETAQAFCRLSAVFGGLYALKQPLKGFTIQDNKFHSLICGDQQINADHFVMGVQKSPPQYVQNVRKEFIARAVFITDRSMLDSEKEHLTLLMYPPEKGKNLVTVIELGSLTGTCPKDFCLVHFIAKQTEDPQVEFQHVVENIFTTEHVSEGTKPRILWSSYFSLPLVQDLNENKSIPENVVLCSGPDLDLDYDGSIEQARQIFEKMYPDLEFLPRAPDPEEIVIEGGDEDETEQNPGNNEMDQNLVGHENEQNQITNDHDNEQKLVGGSKETEESHENGN